MAITLLEIPTDAVTERRRLIKTFEDALSWQKVLLRRDEDRLNDARARQPHCDR
jgi:hypothetical protein